MGSSLQPITELALKKKLTGQLERRIIIVLDRGKKTTMFNPSVYLLLLTTLEVSALFLSLGRHCLCQFFLLLAGHKLNGIPFQVIHASTSIFHFIVVFKMLEMSLFRRYDR